MILSTMTNLFFYMTPILFIFSVDEWSDVECKTELRFAKKHLPELCECLGIPEKITCVQRTVCGGMEGLCILLKRLAYPCRYTDMVPRFGRNPTELCLIFNTMIDFIYDNHNHRLRSWDQFFLQPNQLYSYAEAVHRLGAPLGNCFGFIDGTVRGIARPQIYTQQCTVVNRLIRTSKAKKKGYVQWPHSHPKRINCKPSWPLWR